MTSPEPKYVRLRFSRDERLLLLSRFEVRPEARKQLDVSTSRPVELWMTVEEADDLREAAQDLLQVEGFDADYAPTPLGRQLETIINKLFTG